MRRNFKLGRKLAFVGLMMGLVACDSGSVSTVPDVSVTEPPPPLQAAPDPIVTPTETPPPSNEVSVSETATQINIEAAPAQQEAASENYQTMAVVEAISEEESSTERFRAANTVQLIYRAG